MEQREAKRSKMPKTEIVCKFFLDAVQTRTYGYKWQCPNGDDCHYKHCLPKDYVIKTLSGKVQEEMTIDEYQDLEETIDAERERLAVGGTKINEKVFLEWKAKKAQNKLESNPKQKDELLKKLKTGRQLFDINKEIYKDDENADDEVYENEFNELVDETKNLQDELWGRKEENTEKVEVNAELFQNNDEDLDNLDDIVDDDDDDEKDQ
jgi:hypothetical protein